MRITAPRSACPNRQSEPFMSDLNETPGLAPVRGCDGCTLCCKVFEVPEIEKPQGRWCTHCDVGLGCGIHSERPKQCRDFYCGYLLEKEFGEHWKPSESKLVIRMKEPDNAGHVTGLDIYVDPQRPD